MAFISLKFFLIGTGKSNGAQERVLALARIEPGMLNHDRDIRLDQAGIGGSQRNRGGIIQIVKAEMMRPSGRNQQAVRPDRVPVNVENRNPQMGVLAISI
jgi:hypothetical protein